MKLRLFTILTLIFFQTGILSAQQPPETLKQIWLESFGTKLGEQLAQQVETNSAGEPIFAGSASCVNQPSDVDPEFCIDQILAEYFLIDEFVGGGGGAGADNSDAQIFGGFSPQGELLAGSPKWLYSCNDPFVGATGLGEDVVVSDDDYAYLAGTCQEAGGLVETSAFLREFDPDLNDVTTYAIEGAQGRAVAIDRFVNNRDLIYLVGPKTNNNSYIAWHVQGINGFIDIQEFGSATGSTTANDVFVDSNHNIYVTGSTTGVFDPATNQFNDGEDIFVIKYGVGLVEQWRKQIDIPVSNNFRLNVNSIVVDDEGMVYVGGSRQNLTSAEISTPFLFKFDQSNLAQPAYAYIQGETPLFLDVFDHLDSHIEDLELDARGNVLAVGRVDKEPSEPFGDCCVIVNFIDNNDGSFEDLWDYEIEDVQGYGIHIDQISNDILVSGQTQDDFAFVAKLVLLGDVNCDGEVDPLDVDPFTFKLANGIYCPKADTNCDGIVTGLDIDVLIDLILLHN